MSRVDTDNVDAALSEAKPQDIVIESKNSFVETALGQLTGIKFTSTNRTPSTSDIDVFVILPNLMCCCSCCYKSTQLNSSLCYYYYYYYYYYFV